MHKVTETTALFSQSAEKWFVSILQLPDPTIMQCTLAI